MLTITKLKKGTSFVEVMIAVLIFAIAILGGYFLCFYSKSQINVQGRYRIAAHLAAQKLEELKAGDYYAIAAGETEEGLSLEGLYFTRRTTAEDLGLYKKVTVSVNWPQMGKTHDVSLVTFVAPK